MRTSTVLLSITSLGFAASTLYLALESRAGRNATADVGPRAQNPVALAPASLSTPAGPLRNSTDPPAMAGHGAPKAAGAGPASVAPGSPQIDMRNEYQMASARSTMQTMSDPALRAKAVARFRDEQIAQLTRLRDRMKLDSETFEKVVGLLAEDMQLQQENYARCVLDSGCDMMNIPDSQDHSQELIALLGADKYAQLYQFRATLTEWQTVVQLRGRLSEANYLGDANAERLMKSLTEEREHYYREVQQQGANTAGFGNGSGMVYYTVDGPVEQQLASAAHYSQRMRARAADALNSEQLRAFNQLQDDLLAQLADHLRGTQGMAN
jgi:hypothetical protein